MKEFQEFLLRQLKENKLVLKSIDFDHSVTTMGIVNIIGINQVSFASSETTYHVTRFLFPELKEAVLNHIKKCFE